MFPPIHLHVWSVTGAAIWMLSWPGFYRLWNALRTQVHWCGARCLMIFSHLLFCNNFYSRQWAVTRYSRFSNNCVTKLMFIAKRKYLKHPAVTENLQSQCLFSARINNLCQVRPPCFSSRDSPHSMLQRWPDETRAHAPPSLGSCCAWGWVSRELQLWGNLFWVHALVLPLNQSVTREVPLPSPDNATILLRMVVWCSMLNKN